MYIVIIIYACLSIPNVLRSMSCFDEKAEYKIIRNNCSKLKEPMILLPNIPVIGYPFSYYEQTQ